MLFNSVNFAIFLTIIFFLYWFATNKSLKYQNILLLVASYFFYSCWDYRFLFLLIFSTFLDYYTGIKMFEAKSLRNKKIWLWISVGINAGFLGFFKYYNFFIESFAAGIANAGFEVNPWTLQIILPVGISFYTFHGLSYVIDIYKNRIEPERNFIDYSLFVSFFPLLVAGPIERATHLLPQIKKPRVFDYVQAKDGLRQILWGLFKKVVIADNCATLADTVFNQSGNYHGIALVLGAVFFAIQIYCDFSGYSDIAIGTAHLFGINLLRNFAFPYFSRDIAEFWRRWHISLSTWFRDYLYIPLGGSKGNNWLKARNIFIIFIVSGFWHGANWTFLAWGLLNAIYILPSVIFKTNRHNLDIVTQGRALPNLRELFSMLLTFTLAVFAWIFFRAKSIEHAFSYIAGIFSSQFFYMPDFLLPKKTLPTLAFILLFIIIEWQGREQQFAIQNTGFNWPKIFRWTFYYTIIIIVFIFAGAGKQFIYFQF